MFETKFFIALSAIVSFAGWLYYSLNEKEMAFVTWISDDYYALGALVMGHSLRRSKAKYKLHLMYSKGVSDEIL